MYCVIENHWIFLNVGSDLSLLSFTLKLEILLCNILLTPNTKPLRLMGNI